MTGRITQSDLHVPEGRAVLFGGTFDPPQRAHVRVARAVRDAVDAGSALVFVPAGRPPLRDPPGASPEHRCAMVRIAIADVPNARVWETEVERAQGDPGPTWWIDTVREAVRALGARPRFIIGADQAARFHTWRCAREILDLADPLVVPRGEIRGGDDLARALEATGAWGPDEVERWRAAVVPVGLVEGSATEVRAALARGDLATAGALLDAGVLAYIRRHGLYGLSPGGV